MAVRLVAFPKYNYAAETQAYFCFLFLPAMYLPDGSHFASRLCHPLTRPITLVMYV